MVNEYSDVIEDYLPLIDEYVGYFDTYIPTINKYIEVIDPIIGKLKCGQDCTKIRKEGYNETNEFHQHTYSEPK